MYRILSDEQHKYLVKLRKQGKSIPEISRETGTPITTVQRHIKGIQVPLEFQTILREKQGGSKDRAKGLRANINVKVEKLLGKISQRDYLFLLIGLYWGEGTKKDFTIINSDPLLLQTFIYCLRTLGITDDRLSLSLRVHAEISISKARAFWAQTTGLSEQLIERIEVIEGKKKGKLPHGMCRVRVKSGIRDRLLIQSAIALIGKECSKRIVSI
ncbi:MAG: hypothetical protein PHD04_02270 [Candidatus Pacebacteria bacterium]|nr:hypothetical protein [Candidatus Paceibacterota bacterium]